MSPAAIDLSPLRKALGWLTEALTLWHAQPAGSVLKPHLRSAVIHSFEFSYELSVRSLRRVLMRVFTELAVPASEVSLSSTQRALVLRLITSVAPGARVAVFGSRAAGRARPFSDLDLLLLEPQELTWAQRADLRDAFEASELPFRVDLVDQVELAGLAPGMRQRVLDEARPLSGAQPRP